MIDDMFEEESDDIESRYGYRPDGVVWLLASHIAVQYVRMLTAKKLGKDTEVMERMIESKSKLISRNIEQQFTTERSKRYGTGN